MAKDLARNLIGQGKDAVARCEGERWLLTKPVLGSSSVKQKRMDLCRRTKQEAGRDASLLRVRSDGNASGRSWRVGCCKSVVTLLCCVVGYGLDAAGASIWGLGWVISPPGAALPAAR
jgi:hypothetical protein